MPSPANVLFIIADQLRADCLGCTGNAVIRTPHLDSLAASGSLFTHCFVQTAPCGPSRMCLYTSRYLCSTRAVNNFTPLRDARENWAFALRQAGYNPGLIGYNDYTLDPAILPPGDRRLRELDYANVLPGFERVYYHEYDSPEYFAWLCEQGYPEELCNHQAIHRPQVPPEGPGEHLECYFPARYQKEHSECRYLTEKALEHIRARKGREKGWVLSLNYIKPHPPNINCAPYHRLYDPAHLPTAARRPEELDHAHPYIRAAIGQGRHQDERHLREFMACYYGMISEVDDNLGLVFAELKDTGQWGNTLIVFTSDHGECLGDHYLVGKGHFFDKAMHVPCIIRDPRPESDAARGTQLHHLVESIDLGPTVLEWLGVEVPDRFQGRSLLGALRGDPSHRPRTEIFYEFDYRTSARYFDPQTDMDKHLLWVVRDREFKYVQFADEAVPPLLFDLRQDPDEFDDLAGRPEYLPTVLKYCQKLLRWRMYHEDQRPERWAQSLR
jgi:arylsulfatase A-like enzyme